MVTSLKRLLIFISVWEGIEKQIRDGQGKK
jgi:hypothetical protein